MRLSRWVSVNMEQVLAAIQLKAGQTATPGEFI